MKIAISRGVLDQILAEAARTPDEEVCGLLLGTSDLVSSAMTADNVAPKRRKRFELDPAVLIAAYRSARAGGPSVVGHYHSHPGGRAMPSRCDAEAAQSGQLWLIVADGVAAMYLAVDNGSVQGRFEPVRMEAGCATGCWLPQGVMGANRRGDRDDHTRR